MGRGDPTDIMAKLGLEQMDNEAELESIIKEVVEKSGPDRTIRSGKNLVIFVGQAWRETKGKQIRKSR